MMSKNIFSEKKTEFSDFWFCFLQKTCFSFSFFSENIVFFRKLYSSGCYHPKDEIITPNSREVLSDQKKMCSFFSQTCFSPYRREFRIHTRIARGAERPPEGQVFWRSERNTPPNFVTLQRCSETMGIALSLMQWLPVLTWILQVVLRPKTPSPSARPL